MNRSHWSGVGPAAALTFFLAAQAQALPDGATSLKSFGAKGDGVADDTAALQAWLAEVAKSGAGYCPAGTYKISAPLRQPINTTVWGPHTCVILPTPEIARGTVYEQGSASTLEGIAIDGAHAHAGVVGLGFDLRPAPVNGGIFGITRNVAVRNFTGPGSVGVDAGSTVHWSLQNMDLDTNYDNLHIGMKIGSKGAVGTNTLTCDKCEIRGAKRYGVHGDDGGQEIYLNQPEIISSGEEGIFLDTYDKSPHLTHVVITQGHIELNNKPGRYQVTARDVDALILRDTKFEPELGTQCDGRPRAVRIMDGKDFLLDNVRVCYHGAATIQLSGTAGGRFVNWPSALSGPLTGAVQNTARGKIMGIGGD
jgi:hypothetical protein